MAHHILVTSKPEIKCAAIRMMIALMTNKKSPKLSMVIGKVKMTKMGLTKKLSKLNTTATIMAVTMVSTPTPGNK